MTMHFYVNCMHVFGELCTLMTHRSFACSRVAVAGFPASNRTFLVSGFSLGDPGIILQLYFIYV